MFNFKKFLLLSLGVTLCIILSQGAIGIFRDSSSEIIAQSATSEIAWHRQAQALTEKGHQQLNQGQASLALTSFQEATKTYRQLHNQEGVTGSLINQSLALQDLGLNLRACSTLLDALKLENSGWLCDSSLYQAPDNPSKALDLAIEYETPSPINIIGLHNLGDILRLIGKTDESETVLHKALSLNKGGKSLAPSILLSLANTEKAIFEQLRDRYSIGDEPEQQEKLIFSLQKKLFLPGNYISS